MPRHDKKKSCIYIGRKTLYDKQAAKHKKKVSRINTNYQREKKPTYRTNTVKPI